MPLDLPRTRQNLKDFDFPTLFREQLGWERHTESLDLTVESNSFTLTANAQKRGMIAFGCSPLSDGRIPDYKTRRKIERQVAKSAHEHLIIYTDTEKTTQIWQWVKRERGKPNACREHTYTSNQSGDALIQKLNAITFTLEEEERLTLVEVTGRARAAFDVDRVTRRFYDRFKNEHTAFLKFISGVESQANQEWYASLMLNRLMFVYFIQKKGFLDGDANYLRNRLTAMQARNGGGKFLSFYRYFLLRLFHEGLGQQDHSSELDTLLGKVPYLNGGLFDVHELERENPSIAIPDEAFKAIFDFFDDYQWHLDERPLRADNEINPDVLGYIFEKYINQKQMGAYYTKEDITEYISKNTVIPYLFDVARRDCKIAFEGEQSVWRLLQSDPDRYIYDAVKKGAQLPLPAEIADGVNDVAKRSEWNKSAPEEYALPTEIWREAVARRQRCEDVWLKMINGEVHKINDLITYNLNIRQFARDVIENSEGPELLRAFWHGIEKITVLDPTCGSGAFLFAALTILEDLYEACLDRMQAFVEELDRSDEPHRPEKYEDFRKILARVKDHPNRRYFILKSIILNNLYGVDIMEEATEICKLRLFLRLVAQVESADHIEPLPDIDFNIRAGNTLVGFSTYDDVKRAVTRKFDFDNSMERIDESAEIADRAYRKFREMQTHHSMDSQAFSEAKTSLRRRLDALNNELDSYLAQEYGVDPTNQAAFERWRTSHRPFHWFVEFYGIMKNDGFDVTIGNPPYVEYSKISKDYSLLPGVYATLGAGNLYAYVVERSLVLSRIILGRFGMIIPMSFICTDRAQPLQSIVTKQTAFVSHFSGDRNPAEMFTGVKMRLTILLTTMDKKPQLYTTGYTKWFTEARPFVFPTLAYVSVKPQPGTIPKISSALASRVLGKMSTKLSCLGQFTTNNDFGCFYHNAPIHWVRAFTFAPFFESERDGIKVGEHYKHLALRSHDETLAAIATLNSSMFYFYFVAMANCRDLTLRELDTFPLNIADSQVVASLQQLCLTLMNEYRHIARLVTTQYRTSGWVRYEQIDTKQCKPIIDEIDSVLAQHYGFTDEELDFIINYDIKFRLGRDSEEEANE